MDKVKSAEFSQGELVKEHKLQATNEKNGTYVEFTLMIASLKNTILYTSISIKCLELCIS
jgi:hypothetical protein